MTGIFFSGAYVNNVKYVYTSACGDICWLHWVDMGYIYWHSHLMWNMWYIYAIWGAYFVADTYMVTGWKKEVAVQWFLTGMCSNGGMYVDYIIRSHNQKGFVAPHFGQLDQRNEMVPLTMLLVLCNANASTSGVTWSKSCQIAPLHSLGQDDWNEVQNIMLIIKMLSGHPYDFTKMVYQERKLDSYPWG